MTNYDGLDHVAGQTLQQLAVGAPSGRPELQSIAFDNLPLSLCGVILFHFSAHQYSLTFALVAIEDCKVRCELQHWVGEHSPHRVFRA